MIFKYLYNESTLLNLLINYYINTMLFRGGLRETLEEFEGRLCQVLEVVKKSVVRFRRKDIEKAIVRRLADVLGRNSETQEVSTNALNTLSCCCCL